MSTYQGFKIVYVVYEYSYGIYRGGIVDELKQLKKH